MRLQKPRRLRKLVLALPFGTTAALRMLGPWRLIITPSEPCLRSDGISYVANPSWCREEDSIVDMFSNAFFQFPLVLILFDGQQVPIISYKDRVELQQERERERAWELGMRR